jgi:imidazole glycerol phosphate synthase glutamine amidotransferase subunit
MTVTLLDYGAGNVPSVQRALHRQGVPSERATTPQQISSAKILILPGVGHYAALIRALDENHLRHPLLEKINHGTPFLGICLGLQALFATSEEAPDLHGLLLFPGQVRKLPQTAKLPHMGWNTLQPCKESPLLEGISTQDYFYFAHSYAAPPTFAAPPAFAIPPAVAAPPTVAAPPAFVVAQHAARLSPPTSHSPTVAVSHHGADFASVVQHKNICGVQFHPEKSGAPGARLLANFLRLAS